MSMNEQMNHAEESILHTYNRFPVMFDHGEGCYLYDTEGKKYLDFAAGIAVNALGYHYPGYDDALKAQIDKLTHISNLYYNEPMSEAGEKLIKASGLAKAFFTNSGTEAIEGALKAARKYAYTKYGKEAQRYEIIAMNHSFHGRSMGALSVTGTEHYREPFEPLIGGVKFADFNDLESVKAQITDRTCAIITEVVQGEGGIYPAQKEFLEGLRALCDEKDIILIFDEIQCGMGRTGYSFAWQSYGVKPDVMTLGVAFRSEHLSLEKKQQQHPLYREIMAQLTVEIRLYVQLSVRCLIFLSRMVFLHMCRNLRRIWKKSWIHLWISIRSLLPVVEKDSCRVW